MLFIISEIITAVAFFLIMFTPAIPQAPPTIEFHCHAGEAVLSSCTTDQCLVNDMQQHYMNQPSLTCKLRCQTKPEMWDIICKNWLKNSTQCPSNTTSTVDVTTSMNISSMIVEEDLHTPRSCMFFLIPHASGVVNGRNVTMYCPKDADIRTTCELDCGDKYLASKLGESPVINTSSALRLYQFWWFFGMLIISWVGMAAVVSIGDAICFGILGERAHLYGKQRLYGSVGWGIFSILAGVLVDNMSDGVEKDYTIVFWMTAVIIGLDVVASIKLKVSESN